MLRSLSIKLKYQKKEQNKKLIYIQKKKQLKNITYLIKKLKWNWAGHIVRLSDERWTKIVTEWWPIEGKRRRRWK